MVFCRNSQSTTPTLQDIQENNLGGVYLGGYPTQLHPENSQVMSPSSPGPVQPLHPAPSTPPLVLFSFAFAIVGQDYPNDSDNCFSSLPSSLTRADAGVHPSE